MVSAEDFDKKICSERERIETKGFLDQLRKRIKNEMSERIVDDTTFEKSLNLEKRESFLSYRESIKKLFSPISLNCYEGDKLLHTRLYTISEINTKPSEANEGIHKSEILEIVVDVPVALLPAQLRVDDRFKLENPNRPNIQDEYYPVPFTVIGQGWTTSFTNVYDAIKLMEDIESGPIIEEKVGAISEIS